MPVIFINLHWQNAINTSIQLSTLCVSNGSSFSFIQSACQLNKNILIYFISINAGGISIYNSYGYKQILNKIFVFRLSLAC